MAITLTSNYWYGNKASDYAIEHGYLDYKTFASAFPHIMANDLMENLARNNMYFEPIFPEWYGEDEEADEEYLNAEVFQWFIVPEWAVEEILQSAGEVVYYCADADLYLWGVTHYGTAWDNVLTDIKLNVKGEQ